jgi:hypothetical protein
MGLVNGGLITVSSAGGGAGGGGVDSTLVVLRNGTQGLTAHWNVENFNIYNINQSAIGAAATAVDANASLYIKESALAGAAATAAGDVVRIERNGTCYINMLGDNEMGFLFSDGTRADGYALYNHSNTDYYIGAGGAMRLRIFGANGNVVIGPTTDAGVKLHTQINAVTSAGIDNTVDGFVLEKTQGSSDNLAINIVTNIGAMGMLAFSDTTHSRGLIKYDHALDSIGFYTAGAVAATIDSAGNVGVGIPSPLALLHVSEGNLFLTKTTDPAFLIGDSVGAGSYCVIEYKSSLDALRIKTNPGGANTFVIMNNGGIGVGTGDPHASALFHISSTTSGLLQPRMTATQKNDIASPATGLSIYDLTVNAPHVYDGSIWENQAGAFVHYANIYAQSGVTAQTITTGGVYEKFTGFTTNGAASGMTADAANDKLTIPKAGIYLMMFQVSFSGTGGSIVKFQIRWNGIEQNQLRCTRKLGTGGDAGSASIMGIVDAPTASTDLEIWFTTDDDGDSITPIDTQLTAKWLSGL